MCGPCGPNWTANGPHQGCFLQAISIISLFLSGPQMDRKWTANGPHRKKDLPAFRGFLGARRSILTGPKGSCPPRGGGGGAGCRALLASVEFLPRTPLAPSGACGFAAMGKAPPRRARSCSLCSFNSSRLTRPPLRSGTSPLLASLRRGPRERARFATAHRRPHRFLRFTQERTKEAESGTPKGV